MAIKATTARTDDMTTVVVLSAKYHNGIIVSMK